MGKAADKSPQEGHLIGYGKPVKTQRREWGAGKSHPPAGTRLTVLCPVQGAEFSISRAHCCPLPGSKDEPR